MTNADIEARLAQIRERCNKATSGEWRVGTDERVWADDDPVCEQYALGEQPNWEADAEFLAHARQDIPWLLDQLAKFLRPTPDVDDN